MPEELSRRSGSFFIDNLFIKRAPNLVKRIMGQCIIVRAEHIWGQGVEYRAISDHFDEVGEGEMIPRYGIQIDGQKWAFWKM